MSGLERVGDRGEGITGPVRTPRAVWVDLDVAFPVPEGHRARVVGHGVVLSGRVPGALERWLQGSRGEWLGVVNFRLVDGAGDVRYSARDQLVPAAALSPAESRSPALGLAARDRVRR